MSVNIHDSMLGSSNCSSSNEIETLVELILVSYDSTWILPDTPDGADEDHLVSSNSKIPIFSNDSYLLISYFPQIEWIYFPEVTTTYSRYLESPIPPPPIV